MLEWDRNPDPKKIHTMCCYLDARDESLLQWITDSKIAALVADNYAVEGLTGKDRDASRHSFLPIHHLCLFRLGVPLGEMWYLHELAVVAPRAWPEPIPAHRPPAAHARDRGLARHADRHGVARRRSAAGRRRLRRGRSDGPDSLNAL